MKKIAISLIVILLSVVNSFAADLSTAWEQLQSDKGFIVANVPSQKALSNGFETLTVALNTAPTTQDINNAKRIAATINSNQKITSVSQNGVNVSIYAAPAATDGSLYKIFIMIDMNENADNRALIGLYGTCTRDNMLNTLQNMSIENIIGG